MLDAVNTSITTTDRQPRPADGSTSANGRNHLVFECRRAERYARFKSGRPDCWLVGRWGRLGAAGPSGFRSASGILRQRGNRAVWCAALGPTTRPHTRLHTPLEVTAHDVGHLMVALDGRCGPLPPQWATRSIGGPFAMNRRSRTSSHESTARIWPSSKNSQRGSSSRAVPLQYPARAPWSLGSDSTRSSQRASHAANLVLTLISTRIRNPRTPIIRCTQLRLRVESSATQMQERRLGDDGAWRLRASSRASSRSAARMTFLTCSSVAQCVGLGGTPCPRRRPERAIAASKMTTRNPERNIPGHPAGGPLRTSSETVSGVACRSLAFWIPTELLVPAREKFQASVQWAASARTPWTKTSSGVDRGPAITTGSLANPRRCGLEMW